MQHMNRKVEKGNVGKAYRRINDYFGRARIPVLIALILAAIGAVLTIIGPSQLQQITDLISDSLVGTIDLAAIARVAIILLAIYLFSAVCTYAEHFIMATVTLRISLRMRNDLSAKINNVPMSSFSAGSHGDILSRITNDVSTMQQTLSNSLPSMISAVAQLVGCLIMMFVTEWRMAASAVLITLVGFVLMGLIMSHSQRFFIAQQNNLGSINGYIEEMYTGHDVVRISRANRSVNAHFSTMNTALYDVNWKAQFLSGLMQPLMNVIGNLGYVVVCVLGAILNMQGYISFGVIVAFILYVRLFTSPLGTLAQGMTNMQSAAAASKRVFDFLDIEDLPPEPEKADAPSAIMGRVEFDHVRFAYPSNPDRTIIHDFTATVEPGQKVAIVGPTGAGKTTMVNLLMRFFELNSGSIRIDGTAIADMKREAVHSLFSMVLQDTWMFEGTVRENLTFNCENVPDEKLERACRDCGILRFVQSLPQGFDTVLNDNTTISAGQKQLFTIARAMIHNCPMLILDEATSSVDTRTELIAQRAMDRLTANRTSFVIAHRLSTIRNADLILVMKDGDIIEQGTHDELLARGGFYADLYNSQFEQSA